MDQPCFLALIVDKTLHFASKHQFAQVDPWEGIVPQELIDGFAVKFGTGWELMIENFQYVVSRSCVLCWFESPFESVAMWDGYGTGGVAIRTTFQALRNSLNIDPEHLRIARMQYVRHDDYEFSGRGYSALAPLFLKRHEYAHEHEVRAIVLPSDESPSGVALPIDLPSLVDAIVVSPKYPDWAIPALKKLLDWAGVNIAVKKSVIGNKPPYRV
jgi:hypothetical protein